MMPAWVAGTLSEVGRLEEVALTPVREAFGDRDRVAREWRDLNFTSEPDFTRALAEYEAFTDILAAGGARLRTLSRLGGVRLDALYARDASVVTPAGVVLCPLASTA
jgi:N-dimethylarginine dimethylaminohydrolase